MLPRAAVAAARARSPVPHALRRRPRSRTTTRPFLRDSRPRPGSRSRPSSPASTRRARRSGGSSATRFTAGSSSSTGTGRRSRASSRSCSRSFPVSALRCARRFGGRPGAGGGGRVRRRRRGVRACAPAARAGGARARARDAALRARPRARDVARPGRAPPRPPRPVILVVFGTTGELIKLAPVLLRLDARGHRYVLATTAQQVEQIPSFLDQFGLREPDLWLGRGAARPRPAGQLGHSRLARHRGARLRASPARAPPCPP